MMGCIRQIYKREIMSDTADDFLEKNVPIGEVKVCTMGFNFDILMLCLERLLSVRLGDAFLGIPRPRPIFPISTSDPFLRLGVGLTGWSFGIPDKFRLISSPSYSSSSIPYF